jgi:hypothetical protein
MLVGFITLMKIMKEEVIKPKIASNFTLFILIHLQKKCGVINKASCEYDHQGGDFFALFTKSLYLLDHVFLLVLFVHLSLGLL